MRLTKSDKEAFVRACLPEFEKYLPAERDVTGTVNLPVANVLAELTNLGWPKGEPYAAAV